MMKERLLRAILLEPEVDEHRLVYADWLADNGEGDRAEFIYLQVRHNGEGWAASRGLELYDVRKGWCPVGWQEGIVEWSRGFVKRVTAPLAVFERCAEELFQGHPVRSVTVPRAHPGILVSDGHRCYPWIKKGSIRVNVDGFLTDVPEELYRHLGYDPNQDVRLVGDSTEAGAVLRLERAVLRWGQELAGILCRRCKEGLVMMERDVCPDCHLAEVRAGGKGVYSGER